MGAHEAQAYKDPGTAEEQSRRQFLANATLAVGGIIGLVVAIPCVVSLVPESLIAPDKSAGGSWAPLSDADFASLQKSADNPIKISFTFKYADGYFPPAEDEQFVWGVKLTPDQEQNFKQSRPDLFRPGQEVTYPAVTMGFVLFSSICPHLGCRYNWTPEAKRFIWAVSRRTRAARIRPVAVPREGRQS